MDIRQTLEALIDAINAVDWDEVERLLSDEVVLDDPAGQRHFGRPAFRVVLAKWRQRIKDLAFTDRVVMANEEESRGAAEFVLRGQRGPEGISVSAGAFFDVEGARVNQMTIRLDPSSAALFS